MIFPDHSLPPVLRQVVTLLLLGLLPVGLTGCYTQLQTTPSPSANAEREKPASAHTSAAVPLNWANACYGARYGLARYYGSLCYSSITGRPWYSWLSDWSYHVQSPWRFLGVRTGVSVPYTTAFLPRPRPDRSSADRQGRPVERSAGTGRDDVDRRGRNVDRSVPRDTVRSRSGRATLRRARVRPAALVETRLNRVDAATMERRARRLRRATARSLIESGRFSLNQPEAHVVLHRLVKQRETGRLSAREQAQVLSRLHRMGEGEDVSSLSASDLPDPVRRDLRSIRRTTRDGGDVEGASSRRFSDRGESTPDRSDRSESTRTDVDRSASSSPRRTPDRSSPDESDGR